MTTTKAIKSITPVVLDVIKKKEQDLLGDLTNFMLGKNPNEFYLGIKGGNLESVRTLMSFPVINPKDQVKKVKIGNAVEVLINGKPKVLFLDGVSIQRLNLPSKYMIISTDSQIGKALLDKEKGNTGSYLLKNEVNAKDKKCFFEIKRIISYSKAKKIFLQEN